MIPDRSVLPPASHRGIWSAILDSVRRLLRVLFELIVAAGFVGVPVLVAKLLLRPGLDRLLASHPAIASALGRTSILLAFVAGYWAYARFFERRDPVELIPRWRSVWLGGLSGSLLIAITILALFAGGFYRLVSFRGFDHAPATGGMILIAATLEELLFRGLLFRILERQFGTLRAVLAGALVFGVLHLANAGAGPVTLLSVSVLGLLWTGVYVLSRNLWATAFHHAAWNFTIFAFGIPLSGQEAWRALSPLETTVSGPALLTGGAFGPEDSLLSIAITLVASVLVFRMAARRGRLVRAGGVRDD